jgi:hypothetical protein
MTVELQVQLTELSAPGQFVDWARSCPDLRSCWNKCRSPEYLLWLAARLCTTAEERRAVVSCLAELTRRAQPGRHRADPPVERAAHTVETWLRGGASLDDLRAAERGAREAASWSAIVAAEEKARARQLFRAAPRGRPASLGTSRALAAMAGWRAAEHAMRVALAAAGTARAAAAAVQADNSQHGSAQQGSAQHGTTQHGSAPYGSAQYDAAPAGSPRADGGVAGSTGAPESWEGCVAESAGYAVSALTSGRPSGPRDRAARRAARLIRRRLPCPRLD